MYICPYLDRYTKPSPSGPLPERETTIRKVSNEEKISFIPFLFFSEGYIVQ